SNQLASRPAPVTTYKPRPQAPHTERPAEHKPERPPLEGVSSLREALLQATGKKVEEVFPTSAPTTHKTSAVHKEAPASLKDALRKIAPAPKLAQAQAPTHQAAVVRPATEPLPSKNPPHLRDDELASMLAVDEISDGE
ncbi:MAG TPA: hypothetical protein VIY48_01860, partial [Candidatus Paceibacterota bacterium]